MQPNWETSVKALHRTNEYKIMVVDEEIRNLYGLPAYARRPITFLWKGITMDEIERLSIPQEAWKVQVYPFVGYQVSRNDTVKFDCERMARLDVLNWYRKMGLPVPPKSACAFCPYQSDAAYYDMKMNHPEDWKAAVEVDRAIRVSTKKGINSEVFLHESCIPLEEIDFKPGSPDLWSGECSGGCHI